MRIWLLIAVFMLAGCTDDAGGDVPPHDDECADAADHQACHEALVDDGDDGSDDTTADANVTTPSAPRGPVTWEIDVGDNSFDAASLSLQVGDTVRWSQSGSNPHTVSEDDGAFDSHPDCDPPAPLDPLGDCMGNGDTFEQTFDTVGDVGYYCKVHGSPGSGMSGTITVLERLDDAP